MKSPRLCNFALIGPSAAWSSDDGSASDPQTPPDQRRTDIEQWLKDASYKTWACEPAIDEARSPSPHGFPPDLLQRRDRRRSRGHHGVVEGAAAMKEISASLTATTPAGCAVSLKTDADSAGGSNWSWYARPSPYSGPLNKNS